MSNVTLITFRDENELDALMEVYDTVHYLVQGIDQMVIKFSDYSNNELLPRLPDVLGYHYYSWFSEDTSYRLDNLEYELSDSYEYLREGYELNPFILIIHDVTRIYNNYKDLYEYFESKIGLMEMINMYIFCTVRL